MSEITFDVWAIVSELIKKTPGLLLDRDKFLHEAFGTRISKAQLEKIITDGDYTEIPIDVLDSVAGSYISKTRLITSGVSFAAGIPSNLLALPATTSADIVQSFAFYIRIAQQLAYIYGEKSDFTTMDDDRRMTKILIYIGSMFGIQAASQVLVIMSKNAGDILAQKFGQVAVTKVLRGIPWKIAKTIAKLLGIRLTKEVAKKGISKALPILGGIVSGAITYTTFGPMAKKLQGSLRDSFQASEETIVEVYEVITSESDNDITTSVDENIKSELTSASEKLGNNND